ncbi:MAG: TIGR03943 family putative permease subunit [Actinomycetota bacterium]
MSAVRTAERAQPHEGARRPLCPSRVFHSVALASWAGVFWFLLISDRTSLYLSSRTAWVVPVGAVCLTIGLIGRLSSLRTEDPQPISARSAWGIGLIVMPVITVLALPPASLGSFAAQRRSSFTSGGFGTSAEEIAAGELSLLDVAGGLRSRDGMKALVTRAGEEVSFTGFVTKQPGSPADEFVLTRFLVSCCVADALGVDVRVVGAPPGRFKADEWVRVTGQMYPLGREVIVDSTGIEPVKRPQRPYLSP